MRITCGWRRILILVSMVTVGTINAVAAGPQEVVVAQNAILEGIQITSEPSAAPGEKVVTCYFIFRDKPSSFFYEVKTKEKKIVFDFNDAKKGSAPIESVSEAPIKGFRIEETRVNVNEDIGGLEPEWHNRVSVIFDLDAVPIITVNEEYSVISFSYKWGTDPSKMSQYVQKEKKNWWLIGGLAGVGVAGGAAVVVWLATRGEEPPPEVKPLSIDDLPVHQPYPGLP